ncbi:hypothetical protein QUV50_09250 [Phascolarctobacterium faecium]|nr:hypothetical protein [Phascolarctobacterium faecium]MDM8111967.1 hypothetical protein [Phascolarctobacterium faecium]
MSIDKKFNVNNSQSFEDILENRGQTRLFKIVTLDKNFDNDELDNIMKATDKIISKGGYDIDETL